METGASVAEARSAHDARAWSRAYDLYATVADLDADDLDRYAVSAMMVGRMEEYFAIRERAYEHHLARRELVGAAGAALWIGIQRMVTGDVGAGGGWLARAARHVEEDGTDSVPAAFLKVSASLEAAGAGDLDRATALTQEAVAAGRRLGSPDLVGLALHQEGLLLLEAGRPAEGLARLDEAMVELAGGALSPMVTGIVYCGAITGCWTVYELRRAEEWTAAMARWCAEQPELGNFTGECRVRRAEIEQLHGAWSEARAVLDLVGTADVDPWAAGWAAYVRGGLDRLQGRYDAAEEEYAAAGRLGCDPQPGLALLRLAQGSLQAAAAMVRRCLAESQDDAKRVEVAFAAVEILATAGDTAGAAAATEELGRLAEKCRAPVVAAFHAQGRAIVGLADARPELALTAARTALRQWVELRAPYQEARTRLLIADACRELGDVESADREVAAARGLLDELGAFDSTSGQPDGPLSPRELEVLRLVSTGATNRAIADQLVLSERTVDRHVSNILGKLGVSSRAAATAYAFERGLF
ncbi:MAG TPA: LuxR C-terminal-related transcriptional regulator [Nocardioides sp.]|nr:LuxR C-terminal-related transcriptional regulator [Nocardioides sp.]